MVRCAYCSPMRSKRARADGLAAAISVSVAGVNRSSRRPYRPSKIVSSNTDPKWMWSSDALGRALGDASLGNPKPSGSATTFPPTTASLKRECQASAYAWADDSPTIARNERRTSSIVKKNDSDKSALVALRVGIIDWVDGPSRTRILYRAPLYRRAASTPAMNPPRCDCQLMPTCPGAMPSTSPPHSTATRMLSEMLMKLRAYHPPSSRKPK